MLDAVAHRYSVLPSQLVKQGDTLDLEVFLVVNNINDRRQKQSRGEDTTDNYDKDKLEELFRNVTKRDPSKSKKVQEER